MNAQPHAVPVLEVGGTHVTAARVDSVSWQVAPGTERRFALDSHGTADEIIATFLGAAATVPVSVDATETRWGVAMPDPFDYPRGIALFAGVGKFDSLHGLDLRAALLDGINPRPASAAFVNDADAFLLGEWVHGSATGYARCAAITLGTGVGSSWLADGEIVDTGATVPPGGRAHRITVDGVPLEELMSRRAIRRAYAVATGDGAADVREIADRARAGDGVAADVLANALGSLGAAIGRYVVRFAADVLVVGGSMSASWDLFEPWFVTGFGSTGAPPPPIVTARDPEHAPLLGAALHAVRQPR